MSSALLPIKPENIDTPEKRRKYTVSVIGCGHTGILHACLFAEAGFKVTCVDADEALVDNVSKGKALFLRRETELKLKNHLKAGLINAITDIKNAVSQSDIVLMAVEAEIDEKGKTSYSSIEKTCKQMGPCLRRNSLVILISTVGVGVADGLIKETLENSSGFKVGTDFALTYCPVRSCDAQTLETLQTHNRLVAASDKQSLNTAISVWATVIKGHLEGTENVKAAEAATLFEAVQGGVSRTLADEFAVFCEKAGIDYVEVRKLSQVGGGSALSASTLGDEAAHGEPCLLLENAENLNAKLRIPAVAAETDEEMLRHSVNLVKDALKGCGKTLRRAKISVLGVSQTPNAKTEPKKVAKRLVRILESRGVKVTVYDPYLSSEELTDMRQMCSKTLTEALEAKDCLLILTGHDQFKRLNIKKLKVVMKMPGTIVDFEGIIEPDKVEKEGLIYRGLGRGVWTK